jgi:hypothetical protein
MSLTNSSPKFLNQFKNPKKRKNSELKKTDGAGPTYTDDLKNRARFYCKSPDQWLIVKKYGKDRLEQFVIEHDFNTQHNLLRILVWFYSQASCCCM